LSRPSTFISYSHKDEDWKDRILLRLGIAQKQELFDVWDDRRIEGGENWFKAITKTTCRCQSKPLFRYQTLVRTIRAGNRSEEDFMRNIRIAGCLALVIALLNTAWPAQTGGRITGKLCHPSEHIPDMTVYARNTKTGKTYSTYVKEDVGRYTLNVPAGAYIVFVWTGTEKTPDRSGGAYSQAVHCGLNVSCSDHSPIQITVKPGKTATGINPCDFYSEKDVPLP
jgi:hypothetical protein